MNTRLTSEQRQLLKDELTVELIEQLVDDFNLTLQEAIEICFILPKHLSVYRMTQPDYITKMQAMYTLSYKTR